MSRSKPPFNADVVGSLLRPKTVLDARALRGRGEIAPEALWAIETSAVDDAVAMQKAVGLKVCTDGEFHRGHWFLDFMSRIDGMKTSGGLPTKFHTEKGDIEFAPPRFEVHGKLKRTRSLSVDDFKALKPIADKYGLTPKQPIPSPTIEALYAAGCRYLQIDDTNLPFLCDPKLREDARKRGDDPDKLPALYVRLINDIVKGRPADLTVCMHMCRGNHESAWVAEGGYDSVAEVVFGDTDIDGFFLEYDTPRAGTFAPLRYLSGDKVAVLGLVTTKKGALETKDELKRRIDEAAAIVPLDRLALSPQCGFASTILGNALSADDQRHKLELIVETARDVWGSA